MQPIAEWLAKIGLERYAVAFAENDIDVAVLSHLTDADLEKIGISLGHRRKMLAAIAELGGAVPALPHPALAERKPQDAAERRQVTVMFSDLVGSTALSARMDPEDLREVIAAYQKCVAECVRRFDGFVAKYMGDGVLVYFGYPQAHEHDAERAVRAGLELIAAVTALKSPVSLQTRVGIATGLVVVGDLIGSGEAQERGIVGETPNLAARLQALAKPNTVVIADGTRRLVGNLFELEDLGPTDLKGIAGPVRAWAALRASSAEGRFDARDFITLLGSAAAVRPLAASAPSGSIALQSTDDLFASRRPERERRERRKQGRLRAAVAAVIVALAIVGGGFYWQSHQQKQTLTEIAALVDKYSLLVWAKFGIGDIAQQRGNLGAAGATYHEAETIADRLAKSDPGNAGWQRDPSVSYDKVGDVQVTQGNLPAALASYQAGLAIADRLAKSDPGNAGWRRDLSVSYGNVGDVQVARGNLPAALNSYQASLAIADRLAKSDPGNAGWRRDLSVSYERVGDAQVAQGNLPAALASYQASLAIRDRLAKSDPGNAGWLRDLSVSYAKLASAYLKAEQSMKAREALSAGRHHRSARYTISGLVPMEAGSLLVR